MTKIQIRSIGKVGLVTESLSLRLQPQSCLFVKSAQDGDLEPFFED